MVKETKNSNIYSLALMIMLSCLIQIVALVKSSLVAGTFGISMEMDAYNFSNSISTLIYSFIIAGISTIVIPCYVKEEDSKIVNTFLTVIICIVFLISMIVICFRDSIISYISGRSSNFVCIASHLLLILLCFNFFTIFSGITGAFFQYKEKYNFPKIINLIIDIAVVIAILLINDLNIFIYAFILGIGILLNALCSCTYAVINGWSFRFSFHLLDPKVKQLLVSFLPILFSSGIYQLSLAVDAAIASRLSTGNISLLNYSNQISNMVNTLVIGNLLVYFYPKIVRNIELKKPQKTFWEQSYFLHSIICLIIAGYIAVGREGISFLFEHGKFDNESTGIVYQLGVLYIFVQQITIVRDIIYRYFYSYGNTKSPSFNSFLATVVNIVVSIVLVIYKGVYGIVWGTVISSFFSLVKIMFEFKKRYGYEEKIINIIKQYLFTNSIMIFTLLIVFMTKRLIILTSNILNIFIFGFETILVYFILTKILDKKMLRIVREI